LVDFLLVLIEFFSLALMAAALLSEICRNRHFPTGVGHSEHKFQVDGDIPAIHLWTVKQRNDAATTLLLYVFTQRNFVANFFRQKLKFTGKNSKIAFCATLWGS